jgi:hypothetical protein
LCARGDEHGSAPGFPLLFVATHALCQRSYSRTPMARQRPGAAKSDSAGCEMGSCIFGAIRAAARFDTIS